MVQIPFFLDKCFVGAIQVTCFGISKTLYPTVQVQTLYYRWKITCHLLLTGFFHKLISVQDVGLNMLHLQVVQ